MKKHRRNSRRNNRRLEKFMSRLLVVLAMFIVVAVFLLILTDRLRDELTGSSEMSLINSVNTSQPTVPVVSFSEGSSQVLSIISSSIKSDYSSQTQSSSQVSISLDNLSTKRYGWDFIAPSTKEAFAQFPRTMADIARKYDSIFEGDKNEKKIYLTMDLGYEYQTNTDEILDIAKEKNIKITFFVLGMHMSDSKYQRIFRRIIDEGHYLCCHSWKHDDFEKLYNSSGQAAIAEDLSKCVQAVKENLNYDMPKFFRFPMGVFNEGALACVKAEGFRAVFWNFAYRDWLTAEQPDPVTSLTRIKSELRNGSVLLLHTVSDTNVKILPDLADYFAKEGYETALVGE